VLRGDPAENPSAAIQGNGYPRMWLDDVSAKVFNGVSPEPTLLKVEISEGFAVRDGVGFDLLVPDFGNFHLNLYSRRNARTEGWRHSVKLAGEEAQQRTWSVGGSVEVVRTIDGGKHLAFVPELIFDMDGATDGRLPFQASVRYGNWRSVAEKKSLEEKAVQVVFKWQL
jgi:hypothetical protein